MGRETDILRTIGAHPHIVGLVDSFELPHAFAFVLDLARGGEVFERVCEKGPYSEKDAAAIVRQVRGGGWGKGYPLRRDILR